MREPRAILASVALVASASAALGQQIPDRPTLDAILGSNQTLEDFESFDVASGDAVNLDVTFLDHTTIANAQGPGLVELGATYIDPSGFQLQWNGDQFHERSTKTILAHGINGAIGIFYNPSVQAMGLDLTNFAGFGYSGTATIFDVSGFPVGSVDFTLSGSGGERFFVGWLHPEGILGVAIHSPNYSWSPKIDDHGYGDVEGIGTNYCGPAVMNSTGLSAVMGATGSEVVADNNVTLIASDMPPDQFGYFLTSQTPGFIMSPPGSMGNLCLGGTIGRYVAFAKGTGGAGIFSLRIDLTNMPPPVKGQVGSGETWYFTTWFRDNVRGPTSNFTDGVQITFI